MKNKMIYALFLVSLLLSGCGSANQLSSSYEDGVYYRPNKEKQSARLAAQEELDRLHYSKYNRNITDTLYFDEDGVVNINYKPGAQTWDLHGYMELRARSTNCSRKPDPRLLA